MANFLGIELGFLEVEVTSKVDVRGSMAVDRQVPVGFESMRCDVRLRAKNYTNPDLLETLYGVSDPGATKSSNDFTGGRKMNPVSSTTQKRIEAQGYLGLNDSDLAEVGPWLRLAPAMCMVWAGFANGLSYQRELKLRENS